MIRHDKDRNYFVEWNIKSVHQENERVKYTRSSVIEVSSICIMIMIIRWKHKDSPQSKLIKMSRSHEYNKKLFIYIYIYVSLSIFSSVLFENYAKYQTKYFIKMIRSNFEKNPEISDWFRIFRRWNWYERDIILSSTASIKMKCR